MPTRLNRRRRNNETALDEHRAARERAEEQERLRAGRVVPHDPYEEMEWAYAEQVAERLMEERQRYNEAQAQLQALGRRFWGGPIAVDPSHLYRWDYSSPWDQLMDKKRGRETSDLRGYSRFRSKENADAVIYVLGYPRP